MLTTKRVVIATICGFIFGFVCMFLATSNPESAAMPITMKITIVLSRALMGFTIGISALRLPWWLHGLVIGVITSLPMAFPVIDRFYIFIGTIVMGLIYGILTELITTVLLRAKAPGKS